MLQISDGIKIEDMIVIIKFLNKDEKVIGIEIYVVNRVVVTGNNISNDQKYLKIKFTRMDQTISSFIRQFYKHTVILRVSIISNKNVCFFNSK